MQRQRSPVALLPCPLDAQMRVELTDGRQIVGRCVPRELASLAGGPSCSQEASPHAGSPLVALGRPRCCRCTRRWSPRGPRRLLPPPPAVAAAACRRCGSHRPLPSRAAADRFMAFDRHMNLVLGDAEEFRKLPPKKGVSEDDVRALG